MRIEISEIPKNVKKIILDINVINDDINVTEITDVKTDIKNELNVHSVNEINENKREPKDIPEEMNQEF